LLKNAMLESMKDKLKVESTEVMNSAGTRKVVKRKTGYEIGPVMSKVPRQNGLFIKAAMEVDEGGQPKVPEL
jgi:hypothetical protein